MPVLGPGMYENMLGSQREIARRWAGAYRYPMAPHESEPLPQVSQYLTSNQYERAPYDELEEYLQQAMQKRFQDMLPPELRQGLTSLDKLPDAVGNWQRSQNLYDPYLILAQMPLPVYITANVKNLPVSALQEVGKLLASGGEDDIIAILNVPGMELFDRLSVHNRGILSVAFIPENKSGL